MLEIFYIAISKLKKEITKISLSKPKQALDFKFTVHLVVVWITFQRVLIRKPRQNDIVIASRSPNKECVKIDHKN